MILDSIRSALLAQSAAMNNGFDVEIFIVIDCGDEITSHLAKRFSDRVSLFEVDFRDLGLSRNFGVSKSEADFIAFLDCDDLISENWLTESILAYRSLEGEAILHPEVNYFFGPWYRPASRVIFKHISSRDTAFRYSTIVDQNPWTALCFSRRSVFLNHPYQAIDLKAGIGFEDWNFNLETLAAGLPHIVVKNTVHFIRQKGGKSLKSLSAKAQVGIRDLGNLRLLAAVGGD